MIEKITSILTQSSTIIALAFLGFAGTLLIGNTVSMVGAQNAEPKNAVCSGVNNLAFENVENPNNGACQRDSDGNAEGINDLIATIINVLSVLVGIVAVIMVIWGGFKFITSGGDSSRVASARQTILFAIIGLIIVALAQILVKFVLDKATESVG